MPYCTCSCPYIDILLIESAISFQSFTMPPPRGGTPHPPSAQPAGDGSALGVADLPTASWDEMLARLVTYYTSHGRGAVPPATSSLGVWTAGQRLERRHALLLPEREISLTEAGFEWAPHWSGVTWGQRYAELVAFYDKYGHCRVRYSGGGLGGWVSTQRRARKAGRLSRERTAKLESIGFIWDARPDGDARVVTQVSTPKGNDLPAAVAPGATVAPVSVVNLATGTVHSNVVPDAISPLTQAVNRAVAERERERGESAGASPTSLSPTAPYASTMSPPTLTPRVSPRGGAGVPLKKRMRGTWETDEGASRGSAEKENEGSNDERIEEIRIGKRPRRNTIRRWTISSEET